MKQSQLHQGAVMTPFSKCKMITKFFKNDTIRHESKRAPLDTYEGNAFLGIDAGSTTTKMVLIGDRGRSIIQLL